MLDFVLEVCSGVLEVCSGVLDVRSKCQSSEKKTLSYRNEGG